jgi:hypothetical protein
MAGGRGVPKVSSAAIDRVDYTPETRILDIWYTGGGRYSYSGVPDEIYRALLAAPSIGAFVNLVVKDRYEFEIEPGRKRFRPD